jgi:uncharacterized protein (DUF433 family)
MRITVDFVLKLLGDGYTAEDIVRHYPDLEREDVYQAAKYGAWLASEKTIECFARNNRNGRGPPCP